MSGKRAGPKRKRRFDPALLFLAIGVTFCVVAWGYLVKAAIDFGVSARGGESEAWWFLGFASLGAVACLFVGLILVARILRRLGITQARSPESSPTPKTIEQPRIPGELADTEDDRAGQDPRRATRQSLSDSSQKAIRWLSTASGVRCSARGPGTNARFLQFGPRP